MMLANSASRSNFMERANELNNDINTFLESAKNKTDETLLEDIKTFKKRIENLNSNLSKGSIREEINKILNVNILKLENLKKELQERSKNLEIEIELEETYPRLGKRR